MNGINLKGLLKSAFLRRGSVRKRKTQPATVATPYRLASNGQDDAFDYERYRRIQEAGNKRKIDQVWVLEENIAFLSERLKALLIEEPQQGICHGTRRGKEQEWFRKYLNCDVIGTEISETALQFPHTIQWDFHKVKPEWIDSIDFIYSNSFDHSYNPEKCLNAWMSCVRKGGFCVLEHTSAHGPRHAGQPNIQ